MTWATSVPILAFLGISVLDLIIIIIIITTNLAYRKPKLQGQVTKYMYC